jgi:hypothetical protein
MRRITVAAALTEDRTNEATLFVKALAGWLGTNTHSRKSVTEIGLHLGEINSDFCDHVGAW